MKWKPWKKSKKVKKEPVIPQTYFFGGQVVVGVPLPAFCEPSARLLQNLAGLEQSYIKLLLHRDSEEDNKTGNMFWRIAKAHEEMKDYVLKEMPQASHIFFLDYDIDVPPETIMIMLAYDADIISHSYPDRFGTIANSATGEVCKIREGTGCLLVKRHVLEKFSFLEGIEKDGHIGDDKRFWDWALQQEKEGKLKVVRLDNILDLIHYNYNESE